MDIQDLKKSLSEMTDEELREMIKETRGKRTVKKEKPVSKKKAKQEKFANFTFDVSKLSPEEAAAILNAMNG